MAVYELCLILVCAMGWLAMAIEGIFYCMVVQVTR
jgi:hypothetical protein